MIKIKTSNSNFYKKTIIRIIFILFLIGIMVGANIAFKEDSGHNMPISILMIFLIPIFFLIFKSFRKKDKIDK